MLKCTCTNATNTQMLKSTGNAQRQVLKCKCSNTIAQCTNVNAQLQLHKCKSTNASAQLQVHKCKCTTVNAQLQVLKYMVMVTNQRNEQLTKAVERGGVQQSCLDELFIHPRVALLHVRFFESGVLLLLLLCDAMCVCLVHHSCRQTQRKKSLFFVLKRMWVSQRKKETKKRMEKTKAQRHKQTNKETKDTNKQTNKQRIALPFWFEEREFIRCVYLGVCASCIGVLYVNIIYAFAPRLCICGFWEFVHLSILSFLFLEHLTMYLCCCAFEHFLAG